MYAILKTTGKFTLALFLCSILVGQAEAQVCEEPPVLDKYQLLRRLSLDLRRRLPSYEEYVALDALEDVPEEKVTEYLASDEFRRAMRHYHEAKLWPNIVGQDFNVFFNKLGYAPNRGRQILMVNATARKRAYRGGAVISTERCGNFEHGTAEGTGWECYEPPCDLPLGIHNAKPTSTRLRPVGCEDDPDVACFTEDGWVTVEPYWNPGSEVKVCAFDAQTLQRSQYHTRSSGGTNQIDCNTRDVFSVTQETGRVASDCGCGPNLRWCDLAVNYNGERSGRSTLWQSYWEQALRLVDDVTTGGHPYSDLILTNRTHINGAIEVFLKHRAHLNYFDPYGRDRTGDPPLPEEPVFNTEDWRVVERPGDFHAGVLTTTAFLLRFQTNRARLNRARIAFTGQYFVPSEDPDAEGDPTTPDLTKRPNCRVCHTVLEPLAAHFAKFAETGFSQVTDQYLQLERPGCVGVTTGLCQQFYAVEEDAPRPGFLLTHQFADPDSEDPLHRLIARNIEAGPKAYAQSIIDDGSFARATVASMFEHLMKRPLNLVAEEWDNEIELYDDLTDWFSANDDLPGLVRAIVLSPQYRRER